MLRKIHLDFHTAPETEGVGRGFDPELFAETLADAHVNYIATPGKCHFGHVYNQAEISTPHPNLIDPEMFPATVTACLKRGIKTQAYWTLGLDALIGSSHPQWRQTCQDGTLANWGLYLHMCFASPYVEEVVIPGVLECIDRCPDIVGFWFDISLYVDGAFYSKYFNEAARTRLGELADDPAARWGLGRTLVREKCQMIDKAIKEKMPSAENFFNSLVNPGESKNLGLVHLNEVENPFQFGGPEKMTANIRWLRGQDVKNIGLVSRFQGPWSDPGTLRTADQIRFDVARTVALGCDVSMGDHRYPDGHLEPEVYRRLAPIFGEVEALEGLLDRARPVREALLVGSLELQPGKGQLTPLLSQPMHHAARLLEKMGVQFDLATLEDPWPQTECIIWIGDTPGSSEILDRLKTHVARGGALLAMDHALVGSEGLFPAVEIPWQAPEQEEQEEANGCGHVEGALFAAGDAGPSGEFIKMTPEMNGEDFPYLFTTPSRILQADASGEGVEVLAQRYRPISKSPAFSSDEPDSPLIVQKGRVIYSSVNLFSEERNVGSPQPMVMLQILLSRLLGRQRMTHDAGPSVVAHLYDLEKGCLLHLLHWSMGRRDKAVNISSSFPRLGAIHAELVVDHPVCEVRLQPGGETIEFDQSEGVCRFRVPSMHIWQVVEIIFTGESL